MYLPLKEKIKKAKARIIAAEEAYLKLVKTCPHKYSYRQRIEKTYDHWDGHETIKTTWKRCSICGHEKDFKEVSI